MIRVLRLEELYLDRNPVSHFEYIVMEVEGGQLRFYIESNANPEAPEDDPDNQFTVTCSEVGLMLRDELDKEKFGCQARVGTKEIAFIMTIPDSADQETICNGDGYKLYHVLGYQGLRCFLFYKEDPKPFKFKLQSSLYLANIETYIITKMYINVLSRSSLNEVTVKELLDNEKEMLELFFSTLNGEFGEEAEKLKIALFCNITASRTCSNCNEFSHKKCSKCYEVSYCSRMCQTEDWSKHKKDCKDENAALKKFANRKHPIRVQAYFDRVNKSPVVGFGKFRNIVVEKIVDAAIELFSKAKDS